MALETRYPDELPGVMSSECYMQTNYNNYNHLYIITWIQLEAWKYNNTHDGVYILVSLNNIKYVQNKIQNSNKILLVI